MTNLTDLDLAKLMRTDDEANDPKNWEALSKKHQWERQCKNAEATMTSKDGMVIRVSPKFS